MSEIQQAIRSPGFWLTVIGLIAFFFVGYLILRAAVRAGINDAISDWIRDRDTKTRKGDGE